MITYDIFLWLISLSMTLSAAAKSFQSCLTLWNPIDNSPPGSPIPGILQVRTLEWVAISFSNAWKWQVKVKSLNRVPLLVTSWTAAYQAHPSMGFTRQEYWSGVPLCSPHCCKWHYFILFMAEQCSIVYTNHIFFIHFSTDGHLGCFYVLAIARKQCCNEPWGACIFSNYDFLQIYIQDWDCWIMW